MLLKSCAMPPVSWPIASIFCAWRSCASSSRALGLGGAALGDVARRCTAHAARRGTSSACRAPRPSNRARPCAWPSTSKRSCSPASALLGAARGCAATSGRLRQGAVAPQHLVARVAAHRLVGRVHVDDAEIGVAQHQRVGGGVEDRPVLLLAGAQRRSARLRSVMSRADVEHVRLAAVLDRHAAHLQSKRVPSLRSPAVSKRDGLAGQRRARAPRAGSFVVSGRAASARASPSTSSRA